MIHIASTQNALRLLKLLSYSRHERVVIGLIRLGLKVMHDLNVTLDLSLAKSILQELSSLPLLLHLLFEHITDQVLVALHEPLGIIKSVLQLLFPVSLDPLQQGAKSELLPLAEESLAFDYLSLRHGYSGLSFASFKLVSSNA